LDQLKELFQKFFVPNITYQYTAEDLSFVYGTMFYETLEEGVESINGNSSSFGCLPKEAVCAIHFDGMGNKYLTLLSNVDVVKSITFAENVIFRVNGYTVNYTGDYSIFFDSSDCTLDMRVPGSKLLKNVDTVSAAAAMVQSKKGIFQLLGGSFEYLTADASKTVYLAAFTAGEALIEDCNFSVEVQNGSAQIIGIQAKGAVEIRNSNIKAKSANGVCNGIYCPAATPNFVAKNCKITVESSGSAANAIAAASTYENAKCTLYGCELEAISFGENDTIRCAYIAGSAEVDIDQCKIKCSSSTMVSYAVFVGSSANVTIRNTDIFADGTTGSNADEGKVLSIGIYNAGLLFVENCKVYGTHSGIQCSAGSQTWIDGGLYEGVGHGALYLAHLGGEFYAQNADFKTANYRGQYKQQYEYASVYRYAAVYIGGSEDASNIKAYFDNCVIDGGGPCPVPSDDGDDLGAEPIRFRGSIGEKDNAIYISNCTLMGDGKIRFGNTTHKLFLGFGNRVLCEASIPSCVDATSYAGKVFTNYEQEA
jgi:hypothetical protein